MAIFGFDLFGLLGRGRTERTGYELYGAAVAAARQPFFYAELGVPDTLDGRFDLVGVHAFLLIRRLTGAGAEGAALAQAVFDAMFNDMDINLREMGVGDLSVGKKVRVMWEAFHGRASAYADAMAIGPEALAESLERNVWRGEEARLAAANLARLVYAQDAHLARLSLEQIRQAQDLFLAPATVFA
jgi:cytochrome b pre-mRNA-processing protein 3